jgi:hypothetical protein
MDIKRNGSQPSGKGPGEYFTGSVRIDPLFQAPEAARVLGVSVTFEPGARTAWYTHPLGQTLIVTGAWVDAKRGRTKRGKSAGRCGMDQIANARFNAWPLLIPYVETIAVPAVLAF